MGLKDKPEGNERPTSPAPADETRYSLIEADRLEVPLPDRKLRLGDMQREPQPSKPWRRPLEAPRPGTKTKIGVAPPPNPVRPLPPPVVDTPLPESQEPRSMSPAPWERPSVVEATRAAVEKRGDRFVRAPEGEQTQPLSVPPEGARVKVGSVDVRVGGATLKKFIPWAAPFVLSALGTVGGWVYGYGRGMLDAAAEVAAVREGLKQNGLTDTQRSAQVSGDLDRVFLLVRQAQKDIKVLQEEAGELKEATPKIQGLRPRQ